MIWVSFSWQDFFPVILNVWFVVPQNCLPMPSIYGIFSTCIWLIKKENGFALCYCELHILSIWLILKSASSWKSGTYVLSVFSVFSLGYLHQSLGRNHRPSWTQQPSTHQPLGPKQPKHWQLRSTKAFPPRANLVAEWASCDKMTHIDASIYQMNCWKDHLL